MAFGDFISCSSELMDGKWAAPFLTGSIKGKKHAQAQRWSQFKGSLFVHCREHHKPAWPIARWFIHHMCTGGQQYLTAAITITPYTAAKLPPLPVQRCQPLALDSSFILVKRRARFLHNCSPLHAENDLLLAYLVMLFFFFCSSSADTCKPGMQITHGVKNPLKPLDDIWPWRILPLTHLAAL